MPIARPPLPLADYQRIFRVLKTVLDGADANTAHACIFFSVAGAYLVEQIYKKKCQPVAGAAFYRLDDEAESVLSYIDQNKDHDELSSWDGFHCWIVCEGYAIDFMAPIFQESMRSIGSTGRVSRKMFQKPLAAMLDSPLLMQKPGEFYMVPNVDLTREVLERFFARNDAKDLLEVCMHWYRKPPKAMERQLSMACSDGALINMTLTDLSLIGAW